MFSDEQRLLQLSSPAFVGESYILTDLTGHEQLSRSYKFELEAFAAVDNLSIDSFLGQIANITINAGTSGTRYFNGLISKAEIGHKIANDLIAYKFTVVPWFWFLRYSKNHHRYENKTVIEIVTTLFHRLGFTDFDTNKLTKAYQPQKYTVQYNETDYDFVQRILAEQGIQYYFTHTKNSHTMVLVDSFNDFVQPTTAQYSSSDNQGLHIHNWQHTTKLVPQKTTVSDYDYEKPTAQLTHSQTTQQTQSILGQTNFEQFVFPGKFSDSAIGSKKSKQLLSSHVAEKDMSHSSGNYLDFAAGFNFTLQDYPDSAENQQYLLLSVTHSAYDHSYLPKRHDEDELRQHYSNKFTCLAAEEMAIPHVTTQPATIVGGQSTKVEGPVLGHLNSDYLGRVKTTHFWQHGNDIEPTTHWSRVLQPIAGKGWGMQFLPRAGDEVMVRYLYGDPNQPIVVGSLHNAARLSYYQLPNEQTKTGIVSRTTGAQSTAQSHQLTFDDMKNKELVSLVSSKDMQMSVKKDRSVHIQHTLTKQVKGNSTLTANQSYKLNAKKHVNLKTKGGTIKMTPSLIDISGLKILLGDSGAATAANSLAESLHVLPTLLPTAAKKTPVKTINYWVAASYLNLKQPCIPPAQGMVISTRTNSEQAPQIIKQFSGQLNQQGIGGSQVPQAEKLTHLELAQSVIIGINGKSVGYPMSARQLKPSDWQAAKAEELPGAKLAQNDKQIKAAILFPSMVKNMREDAPKGTDYLLTDEEIAYCQQNGNTAMLFIHGYNVPFGAFPSDINNLNILTEQTHFGPRGIADISYSTHSRSYYSDMDIIKKCYPGAAQTLDSVPVTLPKELQSSKDASKDFINGEAAHNWFIRMEDNLNRATNQFDRSDYSKYTRCVHVAWSGDWGALNYLTATKHADNSAYKLTALLQQLSGKNIKVNITAHSLGNRLLLGALNKMPANSVEHIFMWEPAVSEYSISNKAIKDNSLIPHDFPKALQAVKKVTVLYNQYDTILAVPYWLASYFGINLGDHISALIDNVLPKLLLTVEEDILQNPFINSLFYENTLSDFKDGLMQTYLNLHDRMNAVLYDKDFNKMMYHWIMSFTIDNSSDAKVRQHMSIAGPILHRDAEQFNCAQALGLNGLEANKMLMHQLTGKYVGANMSPWATGHSYMHVPSEDVMREGYKKWVINQANGVANFGLYDKSQFTLK